MIGDLNRPLQTPNPSFGTRLLLGWGETGPIKIRNNKQPHTRIDPCTKKGSTLDVGVISMNLRQNILGFKVDTKKEWTPYSMSKRGKSYTKRFSDHMNKTFSKNEENPGGKTSQ